MAEDTEDAEQTEFLLVCENGDIQPFDDYHDAYEALTAAVKRDVEKYGEETAREGVIHPYGMSINVMRDGRDVTEDWERNEPHKPLSMD
ncbi:hypothetical protein EDD90_2001 [Streptomyces sp. Ag109_O5-1]|uniref:hypothetical protein n=1 Tax=Streptomyces sp. Ag109_O5-1 TaxID=1938851 RepID=UPI000F4E807A|nr:hypothetical protein [Streptomyces sp. Ag109_O5-1]RPE39046.1 hypothetical protein EDD90_2001 [Streptomyces sp. Ag109_O5-1]